MKIDRAIDVLNETYIREELLEGKKCSQELVEFIKDLNRLKLFNGNRYTALNTLQESHRYVFGQNPVIGRYAKTGKINLNDINIDDPIGLAALAKILTHKSSETNRDLYLDETGKIVGHDSTTYDSSIVCSSFIESNDNGAIKYLLHSFNVHMRGKKLGASSFVAVHNHPNSVGLPSEGDKNACASFYLWFYRTKKYLNQDKDVCVGDDEIIESETIANLINNYRRVIGKSNLEFQGDLVFGDLDKFVSKITCEAVDDGCVVSVERIGLEKISDFEKFADAIGLTPMIASSKNLNMTPNLDDLVPQLDLIASQSDEESRKPNESIIIYISALGSQILGVEYITNDEFNNNSLAGYLLKHRNAHGAYGAILVTFDKDVVDKALKFYKSNYLFNIIFVGENNYVVDISQQEKKDNEEYTMKIDDSGKTWGELRAKRF